MDQLVEHFSALMVLEKEEKQAAVLFKFFCSLASFGIFPYFSLYALPDILLLRDTKLFNYFEKKPSEGTTSSSAALFLEINSVFKRSINVIRILSRSRKFFLTFFIYLVSFKEKKNARTTFNALQSDVSLILMDFADDWVFILVDLTFLVPH